MPDKKKEHAKVKSDLHPRNDHRERYDFKVLIKSCPELQNYIFVNKFEDETIDFFDPKAVKTLNKALLKHFYKIDYWDIPNNYLCPPIPGRADYIHYAADLLSQSNNNELPDGDIIRCLDIGTGANCVYPLIGTSVYNWNMVGSDIDVVSIESARTIIDKNLQFKDKVEIRQQPNPKDIFFSILNRDEHFDLVICNPPFFSSAAEAEASTFRKIKNLKNSKEPQIIKTFGGNTNELWCKGGEDTFIRKMIRESRKFPNTCLWYTTIVSKESNLKGLYKALNKVNALNVQTIPMGQGNKKSRILAWTFLNRIQHKHWAETKWDDKKIV